MRPLMNSSSLLIKTCFVFLVLILRSTESIALQSTPNNSICSDTTLTELEKASCNEFLSKPPGSLHSYKHLEVHTPSEKNNIIEFNIPDTLHIIAEDLTIKYDKEIHPTDHPVNITKNNIAILGVNKPEIRFFNASSDDPDGFIHSSAHDLVVSDIKLKIPQHSDIIISQFIHITGGSSELHNIEFEESDASARAVVYAESASSVNLSGNISIKSSSSGYQNPVLKTINVDNVNVKGISMHDLAIGCTAFSFENVKNLIMDDINGILHDQFEPITGIFLLYTKK